MIVHDDSLMSERYQRCAADGCNLLSLTHTYCVACRAYGAGWDCPDCGWTHHPDDECVDKAPEV